MCVEIGGCIHCTNQYCSKRLKLFSHLNKEELSKINNLIIREKCNKGEVLFHEGQLLENLYVVSKGRLKAYKITPEGKEQILYIFSEGDFFGDLSLLRGERLNFNIEAIEETVFCVLRKNHFRNLILSDPSIALKALEMLAQRLQDLEMLIEGLGLQNATLRIAKVLSELAKRYGNKVEGGIEVNLSLRQEDLASYTGMARETVSRKLGKLQDEGIIKFKDNKKLLVTDINRLSNYVE